MSEKRTIAIVNDEKALVTSLRMVLEREGFNVRAYANTRDALALIEDPVDLALLDKMNPPLGGMELYKRIRRAHSMPVIFLSASADDIETELRGTRLEAQGYVECPFSSRDLVAKIRDVLQMQSPYAKRSRRFS